MKTKGTLGILLMLTLAITACKEQKKENATDQETENSQELTQETLETTIAVTKLQGSPAYTDAVLALDAPENSKILQGGEATFSFTVSDYELGAQTMGPNAEALANSGKGQHIHFILNNQPYSAHYEPEFQKELPDGVHHLVAFLSRSYHESVKNENSVVVKKLEVGENPVDSLGLDMEAPTLIYSRPKGTYKGADTARILLDFFVLNTTLAEDGHKVRATINDETFTITEWVPHVITGLPMGESTIQLELIDAAGNGIAGPFNTVTRTVTLTP